MEKINKISNSKYEIEINLTKEEVAKYIEQAISDDIKKVKEPGFREGKMPKNIFLKKYGVAAVYPTAIDLIINDIYPKLVTENELKVVAQPNFDWTGVKIDENEGFFVKGDVEVMPEFDLINFDEVKNEITKDEVIVEDAEVELEINNIMAKDATYEAVTDEGAENGDITVIDFEGFVDEVAFEGGKGEKHSLTLGSNSFIPGFEEQLIGTKAGENKDVKVTFPENYQAENLAGKEAVFKCLVHEVKKRNLPELTDEKVAELEGYEAKTIVELKEVIKNNLMTSKEQTVNFDYEKKVLEAIITKMELEIPQAMINEETDHAIKNLEANFKQQGFGLEMYLQMTGMDMDTLKIQMNVESKERIAKQLIIDKYLSENELEISEQEITDRIAKLQKDYNITEEEIIKQIGEDKKPLIRDLQYEKANEIIFK